jgi:dihydrofolate reductase
MARKITLLVANSLDNFIATPDGDVEWLLWSDEVGKILAKVWKPIDTVVMGRKTYEVSVKLGGGSFPGVTTYVFSRTIKPENAKDVEIVSTDAVAFIRKLKQKRGKEILWMGGGEFAKSLFEAGLIDEISLNTHPVLLGSGVPLFLGLSKSVDLSLVECLPIEHGCICLTYRVKRGTSSATSAKARRKSVKKAHKSTSKPKKSASKTARARR